MPIARGQFVRSLAGRDKNSFLVVVSVAEKTLSLCDGKERPLERPKKKNQKHIGITNCRLAEEQMKTNKQIRHALRDFSARNNLEGRD